jgi:uncharacterized Zn finger protein
MSERDDGDQPGRYRPEWWDSGGPLPVDGGIKARSRRGAIGEQWWSRRFIAVLESFGMRGRLTRGRYYARRGQVVEFALSTGVVTAQVQGSRARPYRVRIQVLPLTTPQWRQVEEELAARALYRAKLLAGEMPAEIEEVFADCGTPLFPRTARDLEMSCSCPDWEVPCKHLAATCYVLAEAFDDDPFLMLAWRGRGRGELLRALRRTPAPSQRQQVAPARSATWRRRRWPSAWPRSGSRAPARRGSGRWRRRPRRLPSPRICCCGRSIRHRSRSAAATWRPC